MAQNLDELFVAISLKDVDQDPDVNVIKRFSKGGIQAKPSDGE